jgi:hypothetical protein
VARAHNAEVAVVERRDRCEAQALGHDNETGVDATEMLICVLLGQRGDPLPVASCERLNFDLTVGDRAVESCFGVRPELAVQEPSQPVSAITGSVVISGPA